MERKIGEIFEYKGEWYQCVEGICNKECYFYNRSLHKTIADINGAGFGACNAAFRSDDKSVVFKKLEKVGEPYSIGTHIFQRYKVFIKPYIFNDPFFTVNTAIDDEFISIEIKQNKVDIEEKKIQHCDCFFDRKPSTSNLKPFDLEAAKAGKPVCTRDGRKARIICFDRVTNSTNEYTGHLIVLVTNLNGDEKPFCYTENGNLAGDEYDNHKWDLMMFPEKKSGWANIVKGSDGCSHMGRGIFQSKEAAEDAIKAFSSKLIDTIKVEWYE